MGNLQQDFEGKVAVVTGGSRGIGAAVVSSLQQLGCQVAVIATGDDHGAGDMAVACDVADEQSQIAAFDAICERFGRLDYAFVNAGVSTLSPMAEMDMDEWDRVININLRGAMISLREIARRMMAFGNGGSVVTCCSLSTFKPEKMIAPYNASKAALASLTQTAAREWGEYNIRVNAVAPGLTKTDIIAGSEGIPGYHEAVEKRTPLQSRLGEPEDIADGVIKLMAMHWVTGVVLPVDGGVLLQTATDITEFF